MQINPFNDGTKLAQTFAILSDREWHCGKHELPGTQPAKAIQIIRHNGYEITNITRYCDVCEDKTVHRRLVSTEPTSASFVRLQISPELRKRTLKHYGCMEAIARRQLPSDQLEVDHRFPQIRWSEDEPYHANMSEQELHKKFQLLTRSNNLWKSRYCERCKKTGERGTFIGLVLIFFLREGQNGTRKSQTMMNAGVPVASGMIQTFGESH
ncbi:MAG: hypothetical protein V1800_05560 [Candidatus Latescibacterota bacterium]